MEFKNWIDQDKRINYLLNQLIEHGVNLPGLAADLNEGAFGRLRKRFGDALSSTWDDWKQEKDGYADFFRNRFGSKETPQVATPQAATPLAPEVSPEEKLDQLGNDLQKHTMGGHNDKDPMWKSRYDSLRSQIHAVNGGHNKEPEKPSNPVVDNSVQKAKSAIATLRDVLKKPELESVLKQLEQEVSVMDKPKWYHDMTGNEKQWYDKLGDDHRKQFDDEMGKTGNQSIDQGSDDWNYVRDRSARSAQQGYQDQGANWNWAAGLANRNRIRKGIDPNAASSLQGESKGGEPMFREWYKKRLSEATPMSSGVAADRPGEVMAPTDPKEIARRKAVGTLTGNLMKKNPQLKPGRTDQSMTANLTTDPTVSKSDPETQQAVMNFFLKR